MLFTKTYPVDLVAIHIPTKKKNNQQQHLFELPKKNKNKKSPTTLILRQKPVLFCRVLQKQFVKTSTSQIYFKQEPEDKCYYKPSLPTV